MQTISGRMLQSRSSDARVFAWLYLVNLAIDLAVGMVFRFRASPFALESDEREYYDIARGLLNGFIELTPRRSLGFPLIEAAIEIFSSNFIILQSTIAAIYALSAPLLFLLVRRLTGDSRSALVSAAVLMVWPPGIYFGISLYSEAVALPLFLLSLVLLPVGSRLQDNQAHNGAYAFASGVCLALTTHVRPMYLLFLPVTAIIMLLEERRSATVIARFALVAAGFALVIAPWSVFMSTRYHHLIIVTSNGGETLAGGLNQNLITMKGIKPITLIDRASWAGPGKWLPLDENGYLTAADRTRPYDQIDTLLKARAFNWAKQHPADAAYLELSKIRYMWGLSSFADNDFKQTVFGALPTILLLIVSIGFLLGLPRLRSCYPRLWLLPLFVSGIALISWGSWRFRQVGDIGLIALSVIGACSLLESALARRR